jgi:hypothetical protein
VVRAVGHGILVSFNGPATSERYFGVQFFLEDLLGRPVDLVTDQALQPELRPFIEREAPCLRALDFIVLPCAFLAMGAEFGDIGRVAFVAAAVTYLVAVVAGRAAQRASLACRVDRTIDLEAWRTNSMRSTRH